jgi:hypothetical protein
MRVTSSSSNTPAKRVGRVVGWVLAGAVALAAVFAMYLAWPILFASEAGVSGQERVTGYPTAVEATGEDGRTRSLQVSAPDGSEVALNAISPVTDCGLWIGLRPVSVSMWRSADALR